MYDLNAYGLMIFDSVRMAAYERALAELVRPDSVVVDIGTGTGIAALLACRLGAAHVVAIEPSNVIAVAEELARENGFGDRITFVPRRSQEVRLDQRADIIVSDLRGVLPLLGDHLPTIIDARERMLAEGGTLIPGRDTLHVALVEDTAVYEERVGRWTSRPFGVAMEGAVPYLTQTLFRHRVEPHQLLTKPRPWAILDYPTLETPHVAGAIVEPISRDGIAHGLALWFETRLTERVGYTCGPHETPTVYGMAFAPLTHPVSVERGDDVHLALRANLAGSHYVWRWETRIAEGSGKERASFKQFTFHGTPLSLPWIDQCQDGRV